MSKEENPLKGTDLEMLPEVTDALKAITDDPEGGTLILYDETTGEETMRFTMPPLKDRLNSMTEKEEE